MMADPGMPQVPESHKACVYKSPGECSIAVDDVPTPKPGPGEVLVKLTHSGVCHSDYSIMMNGWKLLPQPVQAGQIGGHEGVGHIVELGDGSELAGVKVGDRVGIKWLSSACLSCTPCLAGMEGCCFNQKISGYYVPGTFQQFAVGPANYVTPVPESLAGEVAAPMLCAGVTTYAALRRSGAQPGQWVVISGAGGGLGTIGTSIGARGMGLRIIGIDAGTKKDVVFAAGAEHFIDMTAHDDQTLGAEVQKLTGDGASAVVVCTASNKAYGQALGMLCAGGALVCLGMPDGDPVSIANSFPAGIVTRMYKIIGSAVGNRRDAAEVLNMATRGLIQFPVRTVKMDQLQSVFEDMGKGKLLGRVVLDLS